LLDILGGNEPQVKPIEQPLDTMAELAEILGGSSQPDTNFDDGTQQN
jgi:hypothetical protein